MRTRPNLCDLYTATHHTVSNMIHSGWRLFALLDLWDESFSTVTDVNNMAAAATWRFQLDSSTLSIEVTTGIHFVKY